MKKTTIDIRGMHCRSCEMLIEDELLKISGVKKVTVSQKKGTAEIYYQKRLNEFKVKKAISDAGYQLGLDNEKPFFSRNIRDYQDLGIAFLFLVIIYLVVKEFNLFNISVRATDSYSSLLVVLLVGITAGISTCMALVGGLVLGISARYAEKHPKATAIQKFRPHLVFNFGRIASFFILGGLIGYAGSIFQLSGTSLGILTITVGAVMLLLGLQLTEIFPRLSNTNLTLPKSVSRFFGFHDQKNLEYSHENAFVLGALTFFLPCGFTQAMQLFAIGSGSFVTGSLTMAVFAIGTTPGLLGVGGLTSIIRGSFAKRFFKFAGLVVIALAIFNIGNGYSLAGWGNAGSTPQDSNVTWENGVQIVRMTQTTDGYQPNSFIITKGQPVKWIIDSKDPYTCAASILSEKLGIRKNLVAGENIIEFTPEETGQIKFSCTMGMYGGVFNVVDKI
jgi:sulfite exporter TauE/SafE/copper chaperone CopZ